MCILLLEKEARESHVTKLIYGNMVTNQCSKSPFICTHCVLENSIGLLFGWVLHRYTVQINYTLYLQCGFVVVRQNIFALFFTDFTVQQGSTRKVPKRPKPYTNIHILSVFCIWLILYFYNTYSNIWKSSLWVPHGSKWPKYCNQQISILFLMLGLSKKSHHKIGTLVQELSRHRQTICKIWVKT